MLEDHNFRLLEAERIHGVWIPRCALEGSYMIPGGERRALGSKAAQ